MENSNVNQQQETFYTYRGVTKCLSAGISFLTDNFLHLVKLSLPFALTFAFLLTAIMYILSDSTLLQLILTTTPSMEKVQLILGGVIIFLLIMMFAYLVCFTGLIYRMLHIHSHNLPLKKFGYKKTLRAAFKYSAKSFCFFFIIGIICLICAFLMKAPFLFGGEGTIFLVLKVGVSAVILALVFIFGLPLNIALPAMYFEKGKPLTTAVYGYKKGLKVWGKVFCLALLIGIMNIFLIFVLSMPSITMICSYRAATLSILEGDAVNIPGSFSFWYAIVLFITSYLYSFLFWLHAAPFAYLYASIKSDEVQEAIMNYNL